MTNRAPKGVIEVNRPIVELAIAPTKEHEDVRPVIEGLGTPQAARAVEFVVSAYHPAVEMGLQKGDPAAPVLTNGVRTQRKCGEDNPTTTCLSALVARCCSFMLYVRWLNTPAFPAHHCYRTPEEIDLAPDGTDELILDPHDPGHSTWIDPGELSQGIFAIRYLLPTEHILPDVEVMGRGKVEHVDSSGS